MWKCHMLRWEFKFSLGNVKSRCTQLSISLCQAWADSSLSLRGRNRFTVSKKNGGKMWWCRAASWIQNQVNSTHPEESHLRAWHASKIAYHLADVLISKVWGSSEDTERHIQKVEIAGESLPEGYRGDGLNSVSLVWSGGRKDCMCQILEKLP